MASANANLHKAKDASYTILLPKNIFIPCMQELLFAGRQVCDMSYFSIMDFIESGKKSLKDKNYWSALFVALSLPSMCSRIAFANNKDIYKNYRWKDKTDHSKGKEYTTWKDKECYIDFCKEVMRVNQREQNPKGQYDEWLTSILGEKFADVLYQLRCDIIHAGIADIYDDDKGIYLALGEMCPSTDFSKYRTINIKDLCETIFSHISTWCSNNSISNYKYTYVFNMENNKDDLILYNRLCETDRADMLEERFIKEHEERK